MHRELNLLLLLVLVAGMGDPIPDVKFEKPKKKATKKKVENKAVKPEEDK